MTAHKERFEEKVCPEPNTGCHLWTAYVDRDGYGKFKLKGEQRSAHRVAYALYNGLIPEGMLVCHTCDVPSCVNPEHLFLGTHADNMKDRDEKGRQAKKLTEQQVWEIFHAAGTQRDIAKEHGVVQSLVSHIKNKQRWSHIHD
jgi:hypothetical protein